MDLEDWLRRLGLERYEAAFRENEIDDTVLRSLTAEDLKELGIGPVGHRRKLLDAIAVLRTESVSKAVPPDTISTVDASPADTAERRQVTVMFSDLVGSTALSARMDPEDLRDIISAYQKCVTETVRRFGGFVARYLGDGVLAYFGYPQAHEDDAECAVRAGLESIAAVAGLKMRVTLQARVGIATGLVVVGDLIGSGSVEEQTVVGETPNIAARLQAIAEPNSLVIADNTRRLLGNLFELKYLGARDLKGVGKPVKAWIALRPSSVESRFDALHAAGLTNLVGREEEVELLLRRWSRAKTGEGQVVLLSGESGIGKSRLAVALLERLTTEPHTRLRYFCSPQHTDSAFYPIISLTHTFRGNYETAMAQLKELIAIADGKSAIWTAGGLMNQGWLLGLKGRTLEAIQMLTEGITAWRSTGTTGYAPMHLVHSMRAYADVGQFDNAWRCFDEAIALIERSKERWYESEIHRIAGEVAWISSSSNAAKAEAFLQRALTIAREQQAKSWELRAALSMARLWHELGNQQQAHDLLAPVYGWFTEGFDTPDLKQAKTLLDRLVS